LEERSCRTLKILVGPEGIRKVRENPFSAVNKIGRGTEVYGLEVYQSLESSSTPVTTRKEEIDKQGCVCYKDVELG